jgi:glycopeptide antibiotics resistance protein
VGTRLIGLRMRLVQWRPNVPFVLLLAWGLFIVYATLLPFNFSASSSLIESRVHRLWERPLRGGSWLDIYGNILLFLPWGLLLAIWRTGRGAGYAGVLVLSLLSGAFLTVSVEFTQLFSASRVPSFIDVLSNTFGSVVGGLIGWPWARWCWPFVSVQLRQMLVAYPLRVCACATAAVLVVAGLSPFHLSLNEPAIEASLARSRPVPFGPPIRGPSRPEKPWLWASELTAWVLAGGVFALAVRESGRSVAASLIQTVAFACGLSAAIEIIQVLIPSRDVDATSVVLALLGSALGAGAVLRSPPREARGWIPHALLIWGVGVGLALWCPPRFTWPEPPYLSPDRVVPFWSYFDSRTLEDLADVIGQVALFVPLGVLLAARSWRCSFVRAAVIGFGLGVVFEIGQVFLPDRTPDISDAISAAAGAGVGVVVWRWGESVQRSSMGASRYRVRS